MGNGCAGAGIVEKEGSRRRCAMEGKCEDIEICGGTNHSSDATGLELVCTNQPQRDGDFIVLWHSWAFCRL